MFRIFKAFGLSVLSMGVCLISGGADAATGRAAYENVRTGSFAGATQGNATARMPSMPTLPLISVGNLSTNVPTSGQENLVPDTPNNPDVVDECWKNVPHATAGYRHDTGPCIITECEDGWQVNANRNGCEVVTECPDGGVKNSEYTIDDCMRDVMACINNGALPNGLNDMFNADLRASIINGMGLCYNQIDKCITDVRRNCERVYGSRADVWIDFNSRKVQPEYYSFVLRKTGLTPTQAERTCLLLDKNTYGKSFAAVNASDNVTGEYNQGIGAYNNQMNGTLTKDNPMGPTVNTDGLVDAKRGHYARWDASNAECLIRVAAYNKDKQISNSWLFGSIGDDRPAEVWKVAGEAFTCNKDLFGFSLMKDTATAALLGVGGGTVLGGGIGAGVGVGIANKNAEKFGESCADEVFRANVLKQLQESTNMELLSRFLSTSISKATDKLTKATCEEIIRLQDKYDAYNVMVSACEKADAMGGVSSTMVVTLTCSGMSAQQCLESLIRQSGAFQETEIAASAQILARCLLVTDSNNGQIIVTASGTMCREASEILAKMGYSTEPLGNCSFKNMDLMIQDADREELFCSSGDKCISHTEARDNLNVLKTVLANMKLEKMQQPESRGATIGKGAGIGAAVGAGAGGIATAITAFVEHDNINCRVGDGLGQVGLNKSYSIDGLKDLYVKWNLNLPDTQILGGGTTVHDLTSWEDACKTYTSKSACDSAQFYYKNAVGALEWVYSACEFDTAGMTCVPSKVLIKSYGVK